MEEMNNNTANVHHFVEYQQKKQEEYAAKFAAEQGGNIADDVEFWYTRIYSYATSKFPGHKNVKTE